jgi:chemotaxis protein CheX
MINTEDVIAITQNILGTMLQLDAQPVSKVTVACDKSAKPNSNLVGVIQIAGAWNGAVFVEVSEEFATYAATKMLMMEVADVVHEDRQDTLGELTNMIGGNIKSIVTSPSNLSLPTVSSGTYLNVRAIGSVPVCKTSLRCDEHEMQIIVMSQDIRN